MVLPAVSPPGSLGPGGRRVRRLCLDSLPRGYWNATERRPSRRRPHQRPPHRRPATRIAAVRGADAPGYRAERARGDGRPRPHLHRGADRLVYSVDRFWLPQQWSDRRPPSRHPGRHRPPRICRRRLSPPRKRQRAQDPRRFPGGRVRHAGVGWIGCVGARDTVCRRRSCRADAISPDAAGPMRFRWRCRSAPSTFTIPGSRSFVARRTRGRSRAGDSPNASRKADAGVSVGGAVEDPVRCPVTTHV